MSDIYEQHRAAFANVSAFVVMDNGGKCVASIAFKYPRDGAGRLYAYVHWFGAPMVRGYAAGGGYDKRTAACASAIKKMNRAIVDEAFITALYLDNGCDWHTQLQRVGFTVLRAV